LNYRKGLHRELSDAELVTVLEYFRKAGVLFVSKKDILARLDADMGSQLDNKLPILVQVEAVEGRYVENQFRDRDEIIKKVSIELLCIARLFMLFTRLWRTKFFCIRARKRCWRTGNSSKSCACC
jgi:hypothetical protein